MRVTMEHRERPGITSSEKNYYVDTTVHFSEEEHTIIYARGMGRQKAASGFLARIPSDVALELPAYLRACGPLALVVSGLIWWFVSVPLGFVLFVAAANALAYGYIAPILHAKAIKEHVVEVRDLIKKPTFSFYAETPAHAKGLAEVIAGQLKDLKQLIADSAELGAPRTFEL